MDYTELYHYGVRGMRWGIRKKYKKGEHMSPNIYDRPETRRVKKNYNSMSDDEFKSKYHITKDKYRKRVNRYGDPAQASRKIMAWGRGITVAALGLNIAGVAVSALSLSNDLSSFRSKYSKSVKRGRSTVSDILEGTWREVPTVSSIVGNVRRALPGG